jgi:DGQHR domain-containing protein
MTASKHHDIVVRALHTLQGQGVDVYAFFIRGADIVRIADISRVERDADDTLKGFQRPEIKSHVRSIMDYLNQGAVLFPNAIILAMSPEIKFAPSRGPKPDGLQEVATSGTLTIPVYSDGQRGAWIVDGQQRSLALSKSSSHDIAVPVIGFVSDDLELQREQFILVNKARPLPSRLINELLPETRGILLPRELSSKKLPSELCNLLIRDPQSPFHRLIRRPSDKEGAATQAVITDSGVIKMIQNSLTNPLGALAPYKGTATEAMDIRAMYTALVTFWSAVRDVFPDAWGKDPKKSRLMHTAGIEAMGVLMDRIYARLTGSPDDYKAVRAELERVAPSCRWTKGTWEVIGVAWNEIQSTPRDIKRLQDALIRAYTAAGAR